MFGSVKNTFSYITMHRIRCTRISERAVLKRRGPRLWIEIRMPIFYEKMEVDPLYRIEEHRYMPKFYTRKYTLRLNRQIINPVIDFMRIIQELADKHHYRDNTCVTFGGEDTNGKQFYVNRVDRILTVIHRYYSRLRRFFKNHL